MWITGYYNNAQVRAFFVVVASVYESLTGCRNHRERDLVYTVYTLDIAAHLFGIIECQCTRAYPGKSLLSLAQDPVGCKGN
jgi:hypothetical protein